MANWIKKSESCMQGEYVWNNSLEEALERIAYHADDNMTDQKPFWDVRDLSAFRYIRDLARGYVKVRELQLEESMEIHMKFKTYYALGSDESEVGDYDSHFQVHVVSESKDKLEKLKSDYETTNTTVLKILSEYRAKVGHRSKRLKKLTTIMRVYLFKVTGLPIKLGPLRIEEVCAI